MTVKTQTHAMFFCFVFLIFLNFLFVCLFAFFLGGGYYVFGIIFLQQPFFIARINQQRKHLTILIDTK